MGGSKAQGLLSSLDMEQSLKAGEYETRLAELQQRFEVIQQAYLFRGQTAVVVFEGWDAAGKGGAIRRISAVMDPRGFKVWPIGAPEPRDLRRHYMARFWERLPARGEICVFDRSWYGRVLVERVEGLASEPQWRRAYREINEFERLLADDGTHIAKVFLYITAEEQLERFEKRLKDPLKRWKLSYEDFRNRERWGDYERAANEMLEETSTPHAPWLVVPANSKKYARIAALTEVADRLSQGVDLSPRPVDEELERRFAALPER
ncbi:polyphosphate kinase 2 family protein [Aureimonas populi]|uniref:Polyphosphate kinase 2 family protein n=1 Tax=Aureimonas populi TaxID=1701758 RepID=A0ABW5CQ40_9HYPH|nr:polyphosphate kinase [Aureimonas populi]